MRSLRKPAVVAMAATAALAIAACGSSGGSTASSSNGKVTLTWWTNATAGQLKTVWQQAADGVPRRAPERDHPGRAAPERGFTTKVPPALASSNPPAIYQQWGGGQEATQVPSGKVTDLTRLSSGWIGEVGVRRPGLAGERQAVRHPLRPAHGGLLVPQGPVRQGRDHHPADDPGRAGVRRHQAEECAHRAHRGGQQGQVAGRVLVGVLRPPRMPHGHPQGGDEVGQPVRLMLHAGGTTSSRPS